MPDINKLFIKLTGTKSSIYIADKLFHKNTKKVDRWIRDKAVPESHGYSVYRLLMDEGYIKEIS